MIHRVSAMGWIAETGAQHIAEGQTAIDKDSTFEYMRKVDREMYDGTIDFLEPIVRSKIYVP